MALIALLIAAGLLLLFLETVLPGLIAGALGFLALAGAVGYAYVEFGAKTGNATLFLIAFLLLAVALAVAVYSRGDLSASPEYIPDEYHANLRTAVMSPDILLPITASWNMDWVIGGAALFFAGFAIFSTFLLLMVLRWRGTNDF